MRPIIIFLLTLCLFSCKDDSKKQSKVTQEKGNAITLKYATGFSITKYSDHKKIEINSPWPNAKKTYKSILINGEHDVEWKDKSFYNKAKYPIQKIVVTSTTHLPALELLGVENTLVGFPGTNYISSEKIRTNVDNNTIRELGKNEGINTEVLLELNPDLVVGFGVNGTNKTFETIEKSGIPVLYNGDWVETSPLAKAEWIKFFGALYNKEREADSIFNVIEKNYLDAKELAKTVKNKPTVLSGAMHKDVWYLPSGTSPEAQILNDANVNYLWSDTTDKGSLALSFETVYNKAHDANLWLSPSYYNSLDALEKASQHYTKFDAFKQKQVYSFVNTTGATGGVLYYELGTARPDIILKDIIKVCHPDLLPDYQPYFFKPLQ